MTQVAALLRPKPRESEITFTPKSKIGFMKLVDWHKVGDESVVVTIYNQGITRDTIKVKVSLA
jgi:hypothetical protein